MICYIGPAKELHTPKLEIVIILLKNNDNASQALKRRLAIEQHCHKIKETISESFQQDIIASQLFLLTHLNDIKAFVLFLNMEPFHR